MSRIQFKQQVWIKLSEDWTERLAVFDRLILSLGSCEAQV